ncbi:LysR family transcriptional regulator [Desertimonas flava]|uniref:LysR family transcriptional regulator n=1 Tax=Desertimonas flava TaxID=2064846 RepID=UPI000E35247D|nr:LysR family transcriptional regulator [Desertimonas flava]
MLESVNAGVSLGAFSNVELRHLSALDAVAREGTFGRAAERLGYTQSAVSQQISALEKAIGGSVFDRPGGPRPVRLTPLGKLVLSHARDILARASLTAEAIERFMSGEAGRVDIGTFQSVSAVLLPAIVQRLRDDYPTADIRLFEDETTTMPRLLANELDAVFTVTPTRSDVELVKLLDDPYLLIARRGEFPKGPVRIEDLDGLQMVAYPPTCDLNHIESGLQSFGVRPVNVFQSSDNGTVLAMVRAGMGPAITTLLCVDIEPDDPLLEMHALEPALPPREISLAWLPNRTLSPIAERFIALSIEVTAELAPREAEYFSLAS